MGAADVPDIPGRASLNDIHPVSNWPRGHPDVSRHDPAISHTTIIRIREAYEILVDCCMNFEISFCPEDIRKGTDYDSREFWMSRLGDDPIRG